MPNSLRQEITEEIIAAVKRGTVPWRQPWVNHSNAGLPTNVISKKRYQGVNAILLGLVANDAGYESKYWGTFKQWRKLGGSVKRAEMGMRIIRPRLIPHHYELSDRIPRCTPISITQTAIIFNAHQTTLTEYQVEAAHRPSDCKDAFAKVDALVANSNAEIHHGGTQACYYRLADYIQMPSKSRFTSEAGYYYTLLHEMAHWSECRVPWLGSSRPEEEIICDLVSGMLACELRIPTDADQVNQHAAYLQSWLQLMEDDENWIYKASSQASTVCDFLLRFLNQPHVPDEDCPF